MKSAEEAWPHLLWISEGGRTSPHGAKRLANLRQQESALAGHAFLHVLPQLWDEKNSAVAIKKLLLSKLQAGISLSSRPETLLLITQDDVQLCGEVLPELHQSLSELPEDWRSLHLCAGYLWGRSSERQMLDATLPGVVPERSEWVVPRRGRRGHRLINLFAPAWPGGPLAMVIRRKDAPSLLRDLNEKTSLDVPDDVSLQAVATPQDFLQRGVLLCHEREQGASQNTQERISTARHAFAAVIVASLLCFSFTRTPLSQKTFAAIGVVCLVLWIFLPSLFRGISRNRRGHVPQEPELSELIESLQNGTPHMTVDAAAGDIGLCRSKCRLPPRSRRLLDGLCELYSRGGAIDWSGHVRSPSKELPAGCLLRLGNLSSLAAVFPVTAVKGSPVVLAAALAMLRADHCGVTDEGTLLDLPPGIVAEALSGERDASSVAVLSTCRASLRQLFPLIQSEGALVAPQGNSLAP